jgi:aryl-alcohol dehydrogenase-like predicted oxidoreductase
VKYRVLGKTGLRVSEIGFGGWAIGGDKFGNSYGPTDDEVSLRAVKRALDLGCTFFDTADVYGHGHSEELLGRALEGRRSDVILATKVGGDFYGKGVRMNFDPDYVMFAAQKSLERLRTKSLDLYQLHNPPLQLLADERLFALLEKLQQAGTIRHYGVSIHRPAEGLQAIQAGRPAALQVVYNILRQEALPTLFPTATQAGVGIIAREPLNNGFLAGGYDETAHFPPADIRAGWPRDYFLALLRAVEQLRFLATPERTMAQAALQFALAQDAIAVVIAGIKTPEQAEENLRAADVAPLTPAELTRIADLQRHGFYA